MRLIRRLFRGVRRGAKCFRRGFSAPLAAIDPRETLAAVRKFVDHGGTDCQPLLAILVEDRFVTAVRISSREKKSFQNINIRRDLEARI